MLDEKLASRLVSLARAGIDREFPYKMGTTLNGVEDLKRPRDIHAVFNGHFDWHSSVHGHWTLVCLLRTFPEVSWADEVRELLDGRFSKEALDREAEFLLNDPSFERMYGWAWIMRLGIELRLLGGEWQKRFSLLEQAVVKNAKTYLQKLDWPVRCGFHPESSFPMSQMLDWARCSGDTEFEKQIVNKATQFYGSDTDYPVRYEPSGNDFFSPGLNVIDLMRRVLSVEHFSTWIKCYLPGLAKGNLGQWIAPVQVSDINDGQIVHLVGLNLSRSWCLNGLAQTMHSDQKILNAAAQHHLEVGLQGVWSGGYEGEHWLGSFALYALVKSQDL
ncbi:MAG: hypothetical protein ACI9SQ_000635 [Rubritalea sp.]|jgi:hypothetical protein